MQSTDKRRIFCFDTDQIYELAEHNGIKTEDASRVHKLTPELLRYYAHDTPKIHVLQDSLSLSRLILDLVVLPENAISAPDPKISRSKTNSSTKHEPDLLSGLEKNIGESESDNTEAKQNLIANRKQLLQAFKFYSEEDYAQEVYTKLKGSLSALIFEELNTASASINTTPALMNDVMIHAYLETNEVIAEEEGLGDHIVFLAGPEQGRKDELQQMTEGAQETIAEASISKSQKDRANQKAIAEASISESQKNQADNNRSEDDPDYAKILESDRSMQITADGAQGEEGLQEHLARLHQTAQATTPDIEKSEVLFVSSSPERLKEAADAGFTTVPLSNSMKEAADKIIDNVIEKIRNNGGPQKMTQELSQSIADGMVEQVAEARKSLGAEGELKYATSSRARLFHLMRREYQKAEVLHKAIAGVDIEAKAPPFLSLSEKSSDPPILEARVNHHTLLQHLFSTLPELREAVSLEKIAILRQNKSAFENRVKEALAEIEKEAEDFLGTAIKIELTNREIGDYSVREEAVKGLEPIANSLIMDRLITKEIMAIDPAMYSKKFDNIGLQFEIRDGNQISFQVTDKEKLEEHCGKRSTGAIKAGLESYLLGFGVIESLQYSNSKYVVNLPKEAAANIIAFLDHENELITHIQSAPGINLPKPLSQILASLRIKVGKELASVVSKAKILLAGRRAHLASTAEEAVNTEKSSSTSKEAPASKSGQEAKELTSMLATDRELEKEPAANPSLSSRDEDLLMTHTAVPNKEGVKISEFANIGLQFIDYDDGEIALRVIDINKFRPLLNPNGEYEDEKDEIKKTLSDSLKLELSYNPVLKTYNSVAQTSEDAYLAEKTLQLIHLMNQAAIDTQSEKPLIASAKKKGESVTRTEVERRDFKKIGLQVIVYGEEEVSLQVVDNNTFNQSIAPNQSLYTQDGPSIAEILTKNLDFFGVTYNHESQTYECKAKKEGEKDLKNRVFMEITLLDIAQQYNDVAVPSTNRSTNAKTEPVKEQGILKGFLTRVGDIISKLLPFTRSKNPKNPGVEVKNYYTASEDHFSIYDDLPNPYEKTVPGEITPEIDAKEGESVRMRRDDLQSPRSAPKQKESVDQSTDSASIAEKRPDITRSKSFVDKIETQRQKSDRSVSIR